MLRSIVSCCSSSNSSSNKYTCTRHSHTCGRRTAAAALHELTLHYRQQLQFVITGPNAMIYFRKLNMSVYEFHLGNIMRLLLHLTWIIYTHCQLIVTSPRRRRTATAWRHTGCEEGVLHTRASVEQTIVVGGYANPRSPVHEWINLLYAQLCTHWISIRLNHINYLYNSYNLP